jgi:Pyruvate/2-oxoacid:ferredoxin oxidoreductase gamma subunit
MDYLVNLHSGTWFEFDGEHVYENLIILDEQYAKPSQEECETGLQQMIDEWNANQYKANRASAYPSIQEQLDMQYWDSVNGTTTWADAIAKVKADYPKGAE